MTELYSFMDQQLLDSDNKGLKIKKYILETLQAKHRYMKLIIKSYDS